MRILLTRPHQQAERFAEQLKSRFGSSVEVTIAPVMRIEFVMPDSVPDHDAIAFTSENGVKAFASVSDDRTKLAFCVGPRTAGVATEFGFKTQVAGGDAQSLAGLIEKESDAKTILFPSGEIVSQDLAFLLGDRDILVDRLIVYRQVPLEMSQSASDQLFDEEQVILPIFSPRTASLITDTLAKGTPKRLVSVSLSSAVDECLRAEHWIKRLVATASNADSLIDRIGQALGNAQA